MKLINPTDDELNAAFAEHVAGCQFDAAEGWRDENGISTTAVDYKDFTQSADAVLPWLEKWNESWEVAFYGGTWNFAKERPKGDGMMYGWVKDKSFPRAAVIALLRAKGHEVEFTT